MKDNTQNNETPSERQELDIRQPHFDIELEMRQAEEWKLGYARVAMNIQGQQVDVLALYAELGGASHQQVVKPNLKQIFDFMEDAGVPPRIAAVFLAEIFTT